MVKYSYLTYERGIAMKQYTKDQLTEIVNEISEKFSKSYELEQSSGDINKDAVDVLAGNISQIQKNCENIIIEVLNKIMNDE